MKFLCCLPDCKHFKAIPSTREGIYLWQDRGSKLCQIRAEFPDPWKKQIIIMPTIRNSKGDNWKYPARLLLRCFEFENSEGVIKVQLIREIFKSKFYWAQKNSFYSFGFIQENPEFNPDINNIQWWVSYSFVAIG